MKILAELLSIYGLYAFSATVLIWRYGSKDRVPTIVVAWLMPLLTVASILHVLVRLSLGNAPKMNPCPPGLEEAERMIGKRRQEMFGGDLEETHFASDWAMVYRMTLEEEAQTVQSITRRVLAVA